MADEADPSTTSRPTSQGQPTAYAQDLTQPPAGCRHAWLPGTLLPHLQNGSQGHIPGQKLPGQTTYSIEVRTLG